MNRVRGTPVTEIGLIPPTLMPVALIAASTSEGCALYAICPVVMGSMITVPPVVASAPVIAAPLKTGEMPKVDVLL